MFFFIPTLNVTFSPGILFGTITDPGIKRALALFTNFFLCNSWEGFAGKKTMRVFLGGVVSSFDSERPGERQGEEGGEFTVALTFRPLPLFRELQLQRALRKATAGAHTHTRRPPV